MAAANQLSRMSNSPPLEVAPSPAKRSRQPLVGWRALALRRRLNRTACPLGEVVSAQGLEPRT